MKPSCPRAIRRWFFLALAAPAFVSASEFSPDAVMAEVEARMGPHPTPADAAMRPHECGSYLFNAVAAALPSMSAAQQRRLLELSPVFEPMVRRTRELAAGAPVTAALPNEPGLTTVLRSRHAIVHFTTTVAADKVPNIDYADAVLAAGESAARAEGPIFGFAKPEGAPDGRIHIYLCDLQTRHLTQDPNLIVDGACVPAVIPPSTPAPTTSYFYIDINIPARQGSNWPKFLKDTCYHEYMHGIQNSYNFGMSNWFKEGQAVWAEFHFNHSTKRLADYLKNSTDSIAKDPTRPLWDPAVGHQYCTGAFLIEVGNEHGIGVMQKCLVHSKSNNDAQANLVMALDGSGKFSKVYRNYLVDFFQRKIPRGPGSEVIPEVKLGTEIDQLGADFAGSAPPTGASYQIVKPDARIFNAYLLAKLDAANGGTPEALLIKNPRHSNRIDVVKADDTVAVIEGFKNAEEILLILTDTTAPTTITAATPVSGQLLSPFIDVKKIEPQTPIHAGQTSFTKITYDLLGTPPNAVGFACETKLVEKNAGVVNTIPGQNTLHTGTDQFVNFTLATLPGNEGHYTFRLTFATPVKSFAKNHIPRCFSSTPSFSVDVLPPSIAPASNAEPADPRVRFEPQ